MAIRFLLTGDAIDADAAAAALDRQGWLATDRSVAEAATSPDHDEGISAFFGRRTPRWSPLP